MQAEDPDQEGYFRVTAPGYRADFRLAPLWNWLLKVGAMGALAVVCFRPAVVPYDSLGRVGSVLHTLAYDYHKPCIFIFWGVTSLHAGYALCQWIWCRQYNFTAMATFFWVVQTFIIGLPSLWRFNDGLKSTF